MSVALDEPATKRDVEEIVTRVVDKVVGRVVGEVVGEVVGDLMTLISNRFDKVEKTQEEHSVLLAEHSVMHEDHSVKLSRIENKLDPTIERVDDHAVRLLRLEKHSA